MTNDERNDGGGTAWVPLLTFLIVFLLVAFGLLMRSHVHALSNTHERGSSRQRRMQKTIRRQQSQIQQLCLQVQRLCLKTDDLARHDAVADTMGLGYVTLTTTQTIACAKTFTVPPTLATVTARRLLSTSDFQQIQAMELATTTDITLAMTGAVLTVDTPQNIAPDQTPEFVAVSLTSTTEQLSLGAGHNIIVISAPVPLATRLYEVPDVGTHSRFILADGPQTLPGPKTFTAPIVVAAGVTYGTGSTLATYSATQAWTPTMAFGGASTGMTYSTQIGTYTRIGDLVAAAGQITLTSKGSATGDATIGGLPFIATLAGSHCSSGPFVISAMDTGVIGIFAQPLAGSTSLQLYRLVSGTTTAMLTNTQVGNTTTFMFSITYFV